jgi:apolipoprotein N-acyltransferase
MKQMLGQWALVGLGALLTGTLLVLALPLGEQAWIAWFMLVPLLWATKEKGFLLGFVGGLVAVFWCAWLSASGVFYHAKNFEPSTGWTYTACGLYAFSFAVFFAVWADRRNSQMPIWWLAAVAVVLESVLLIEIPATVALTQYRSMLAHQAAGIGGIWCVSFLVWYSNILLVRYSPPAVKTWPTSQRMMAAILTFFWISSIALTHEKFLHPEDGMTVGVAQIADGLDKELVDAHRKASEDKPAFVVWPEFSGMLFVRGDDVSKLLEISMDSAPFITSFRDTAVPLPHNVAALYSAGKESNRYEKRKLFAAETKMHAPGNRIVSAVLPGYCLGLNICFDSCYPTIIRQTADLPDVKVVALPTIDPDSPHYFVAAVHAAYTPFRCAENGVAMVRADGHFGSMIVNEHGQIVAELHDEQKSLTATISGERPWTLYQILGDWFWYLCIVVVFGFPFYRFVKAKKNASASP